MFSYMDANIVCGYFRKKNHSILTDGMVINQIIAQNLNETSIYIKVRILF